MLAVLLILLGAVMRLLPHAANFTPIAAIALFGGVYLRPRYALFLPIVALVGSDIILGFDSFESRLTVYGSFMVVGLIGVVLRKHKSLTAIIMGTFVGSVVFYLVTNFAYFYSPAMYAHNWSGVVSSYYNALPFFRNTLLGDVFYVGLLFGLYEAAAYVAVHKGGLLNTRQIRRGE